MGILGSQGGTQLSSSNKRFKAFKTSTICIRQILRDGYRSTANR